MKVNLSDGTEVEVADDNPLAVASRELEYVKGLGFNSVAEYHSSRESEVEKLKKQTTADNEMIQRQKTELGTLRKQSDSDGTEEEEEKPTTDKGQETPEAREARYAKMNDSLQQNLTEEQQAHADEEFAKAYDEASPQDRADLMTEEGKNAFMSLVFPDKQTEKTPISLFRKPEAKPQSVSERVKSALQENDQGRSRRPVIPQTAKSGFKPKVNEQKPVSTAVTPSRTGGVLDALRQHEAQNSNQG